MGMRRVCCKAIPKHWWFCCGLSMHETMATLGKPVTLKLPVNIYPCGTWNHIFNTTLLTYCYTQVKIVINMETIFPQTCPYLLVNLTANLMTGTLTKAELNLRWLTSYTIKIKCLHQTLIPY